MSYNFIFIHVCMYKHVHINTYINSVYINTFCISYIQKLNIYGIYMFIKNLIGLFLIIDINTITISWNKLYLTVSA